MSWKHLSVSKKIGIGFGVLIAIVIAVGYVGYNGLGNVTDRLEKADDANSILKYSLNARRQEKNFMLRKDEESKSSHEKLMQDIYAQIETTRVKFKQKVNIDQIDRVKAEAEKYEKGFASWIQLNEQQIQLEKTLLTNARAFIEECERMSQDQKAKLVQDQNEAEAAREDRLWKADAANRLIKFAQACRLAEKNYMLRQDPQYITTIDGLIDGINKLAAETIDRFKDTVNKEQAHRAITAAAAYKKAFDGWVKADNESRTSEAPQTDTIVQDRPIDTDRANALKTLEDEMVGQARAFVSECETMSADQKAKLAAANADGRKKIDERIAIADDANRLIKFALEMRRDEKNYMLRTDKQYLDNVESKMAETLALCDSLDARFKDQANKIQLATIRTAAQQYKTAFDAWVNADNQKRQNEQTMVDAARLLEQECDTLRADQKDKMESAIRSANITSLSFISGAILFGVFLGFLIARSITKPLAMGVAVAQRVAEGDLTVKLEVETRDEIGVLANALNLMIDRTSEVVSGIQQSAEQVSSSSEELSASSQNLANSATEQAASLEETSASIEQLTTSIDQNAHNAKRADEQVNAANQLSQQSLAIAQRGIEQVQKLGFSMKEIKESSKEIVNVIDLITDISDQTNLLALNAAIEAARAGEAGKGFAVVAVEVRKLAERSQVAAKDIAEKIKKSSQIIDEGSQMADASNEGLSSILKSAEQVAQVLSEASKLAREISAASLEQSNGADQIRQAIVQLDEVTQQNSSTSEECASASEQLTAQAVSLQELVSQFRIRSNGYHDRHQISHIITPHTRHSIPTTEGHASKQLVSNPRWEDTDSEFN